MAGENFPLLGYALMIIWTTAMDSCVAEEKECRSFSFPTLSNGTLLTIPENTSAVVPFHYATKSCDDLLGDVKIIVGRQRPGSAFEDFCSIVRVNGSCAKLSDNSSCACLSETGEYVFRKYVTRNDSGTWTWDSSDNRDAGKQNIIFNITYPPEIDELSLNSQTENLDSFPILKQGTPLNVACSWKNGNPQVTAHLLDRHGRTLSNSITSGQVKYTFDGVNCTDAGSIRCHVPGASHEKTARLLVECPPALIDASGEKIDAKEGQSATVTFRVRTHVDHYRQCNVTRPSTLNAETVTPEQTTSSVSVAPNFTCMSLKGTPPDLTLSVLLSSIRKEDEGQWRVNMTNDVGFGYLDFVLQVEERVDNTTVEVMVTVVYYTDPPTTTTTPTETTAGDIIRSKGNSEESSGGAAGGGLIAGIIVFVLVLVVAAAVVYYLFVYKKKAQLRKGGEYMNTRSSE